MQGFYFLIKFGVVLIYILKVQRKKSFSILLRKNIFNSLLHFFFFFFWKAFSKCFKFSKISLLKKDFYLSLIINYWSSVFTLYLTRGAFSLVCVVSVFLFFLSFFFISLVFFLTDSDDESQDRWDGRGNNCFSCFPLQTVHEHSFSSFKLLPLLFTQSTCNYHTNGWWDLFHWCY